MRRIILGMKMFLLFLLIHISGAEQELKVESKLGQIRGMTVEFSEDGSIQCPAFLGVPFAIPPMGSLRFQKPEPIPPQPGGFDATSTPPQCIQTFPNEMFAGSEKGQSEDCLYLNLILPPGALNGEKNAKYPVMVWFHGGGFGIGSISAYFPSSICGNLAVRDVIVVSAQYRLGIFGFLALEGGNWGLHDQIQALRWLQENIESFGGDPERVTIFGESAGAASVSILTYIPEARPLFNRAIAQSGSAFAYWVINNKAPHNSRRLAKALSCAGTPAEQTECIRQKSTEEIEEAHLAEFGTGFWDQTKDPEKTYIGGGHDSLRGWSFDWVPTVDGDLIPTANLEKLLKDAPAKPFITGVLELESILLFLPRPGFAEFLSVEEDKIQRMILDVNDFQIETFEENLLDALSILKDPASFGTPDEKRATKQNLLYKVARFVFLKSQESPENKTFLTEQLLQLNSDLFMNVPCIVDAVQKKRAGHPTWLYNYKFVAKGLYPEDHSGIQAAAHTDDLIIFAPSAFTMYELDEAGRKVRDRLCRMWTDFAKVGMPSSELEWPQFESLERPVHLEIDKEMSVKEWDFHRPNIPLWTELAPEIEQIERGSRGKAAGSKQEL